MKRDKNKFTKLEDFDGGFVTQGNNLGVQIKGKGTLLLNNETPIHDVYYVEVLKYNLLTASQIHDNGLNVSFDSHGCEIRNN